MINYEPKGIGERWVLLGAKNSTKNSRITIAFFLIMAFGAIILSIYAWYIRNVGLLFLFFPQAIGFSSLTLQSFERSIFYRIINRQEKTIIELQKKIS